MQTVRKNASPYRRHPGAVACVAVILLSSAWPAATVHAFSRSLVCEVPGERLGECLQENPDLPLWWNPRDIMFRVNVESAAPLEASRIDAAVRESLNAWSLAGDPPCTDLNLYAGGETTSMRTNGIGQERGTADRENVIVWRQTGWPYGDLDDMDTDVIAFTTVAYWPDTGEIIDADIDVNSEYFTWSATDAPPYGPDVQDVQNVITHELGHAIGVGHSQDPFATMYRYSYPGNIEMRDLADDDIAAVCWIYPYGGKTPKGLALTSSGLTTTSGCSVAAVSQPGALTWILLLCLGWRRIRAKGC